MSRWKLSLSAHEDEWNDKNHKEAQFLINILFKYNYVQSKIYWNNIKSDFCEFESEKQSNSMQYNK